MNPFLTQASTMAGPVDGLLLGLLAVCGGIAALVCALIVYFAVKYREGAQVDRTGAQGALWMEILWTAAPLVVGLGLFAWGAELYVREARAPADALEIHVIAKQWMWKFYHPGGQREINELHVPVGRPVRLSLTSEDVIHSFFVPAFRVKNDVIPGRYTGLWFEANQPGTFHLFCAQYCGAQHSGMIGTVVAEEPARWASWLAERPGEPPARAGERAFARLGCAACHLPDGSGRGPSMIGLAGRTVKLAGGGTAVADRTYLRESIVNPTARLVAGYEPVMPTYQGQVSEEELDALVTFLEGLRAPEPR